MDQKEIAMNGAGVAELGFPMWPQFDPKTKQDMADALDSGLVSYWTGKKGMEFEEKFRQWSGTGIPQKGQRKQQHQDVQILRHFPGNQCAGHDRRRSRGTA